MRSSLTMPRTPDTPVVTVYPSDERESDEPTILTIINIGGQLAPAIAGVSFGGPSPFQFTTTCQTGLELGQDDSCEVSVTARPAKEDISRTLTVAFADGSVVEWTIQTPNYGG